MNIFTRRCGCGNVLALRTGCAICTSNARSKLHALGIADHENRKPILEEKYESNTFPHIQESTSFIQALAHMKTDTGIHYKNSHPGDCNYIFSFKEGKLQYQWQDRGIWCIWRDQMDHNLLHTTILGDLEWTRIA